MVLGVGSGKQTLFPCALLHGDLPHVARMETAHQGFLRTGSLVWQMRLLALAGVRWTESLILDTSSCGAWGGRNRWEEVHSGLISVLLPKEMELGTAEGKHGQRLASSALTPAL